MLRHLLMACFVLGLFSAKASHNQGAYVNYWVTNMGQTLEVELHVFRNVNSANHFFPNSITVNGPLSFLLNRNDSILHTYGDPSCPAGYYYELIYRGNRTWNGWLGSGGQEFDIDLLCCFVESENTPPGAFPSMNITFWLDTYYSSNDWRLVDFDSRGMRPPLHHNAYTVDTNYLSYSYPYLVPGIDSVGYKLVDTEDSPGLSIVYKSGYSGVAPVPDKSENFSNSNITFNQSTAEMAFLNQTWSTDSGHYLVSILYEYFKDGTLVSTALGTGTVLIDKSLTVNTAPGLRYGENGGPLNPVTGRRLKLKRTLRLGDSIDFYLRAVYGGDSLRFSGMRGFIDSTVLGSSPNGPFNLPQWRIVNPGGNLVNRDSSALQIRWKPNLSHFTHGSGVYKLWGSFKRDTCKMRERRFEIEIELKPSPRIQVDGLVRDSLQVCFLDTIQLKVLFETDTLSWFPRHLFDSPDSLNSQLIVESSRWIYLVNNRGERQDSLYLNLQYSDPLDSLSIDYLQAEINLNHTPVSAYQLWKAQNLIIFKGRFEDRLPLMGAGSFSVFSYSDTSECPSWSDTAFIPYNDLFSSNFGSDSAETLRVLHDQLEPWETGYYFQTLSIPDSIVRKIDKVSIYGVKNLNQNLSQNATLRFAKTSGAQQDIVDNIGAWEYLNFNANLDLDSIWDLELRLELPGDFDIQLIEGSGNPLLVNGIEYSNFYRQIQLPNGTIITDTLQARFPIGLTFESNINTPEWTTQIKIYPNPAEEYFYVERVTAEVSPWILYDLNGRMMSSGVLLGTNEQISLQGLTEGMYILDLGYIKKKILVE